MKYPSLLILTALKLTSTLAGGQENQFRGSLSRLSAQRREESFAAARQSHHKLEP